MNLFSHMIAEYSCTNLCGYHISIPGATLSKFHIIIAVVVSIPLWLISLREPWYFPWYYLFCILAGEIFLIFISGFLLSILFMPFTIWKTNRCKQCGAPMFMAGRHFDPKGSKFPKLDDILIFVVFIIINIGVWLLFVSGYFVDIAMSSG